MTNLSKFFVILFFGLINAQAFAQSLFSGTITGNKDAQIFIGYNDSQHKWVTDSTNLQNTTFSFKLNINEPTYVYFSAKPALKGNNISVYLEPAQ